MLLWLLLPVLCVGADPVYILHDTPAPAQALARGLTQRGIDVKLEEQPAFKGHMNELKAAAVFMYVHNAFDADIENALIAWTERGGRLIVVHHGMASGRMKNERWPGFLGVRILPRDDPQYPWKVFRGVFEVVNLNPAHFITSNKVQWPKTTQYTPSDGRSKTVLLGMKGDVEGRAIMQDRAAWLKPAGKGWIVYFQMGHESRDFENGSFMQMIENALRWKP